MKRSEKIRNVRQIPFRIHANDYILLKKLLVDDGMKFQTFVASCVEAYMRGDPNILKCVKDWKEISAIPRVDRDKYSLSHRDRQKILDEIEDAASDDM